ncbi:FAD/NAD(P)-binding domain-containing protein [Cryphonectria parasitica EP155]|uniref:FAD/NAD(P)-binding domain-containing protein n=1 Tax=Cryphonectria parasitica (strain ATCC 38755 / EP155) TaxID=660469 RepID=A0A9P5CJK8_CRYP1|nr:FAD/NAD(P)-binding domain-containing protein [Cryphonectria parasitica EP155]KAF3760026.1 FAD/NAD(P)-binding domain-containing protein [Cryphonectria parasitica EP155]
MVQQPKAFIHRLTYKAAKAQKTVVIVGGSYAGIFLARRLCEMLPGDYKVVMVEKNSHFHSLFILPRYCVVPGHEPKAFIPYDEILCDGRGGTPTGIFERRQDTVVEVTEDGSVRLASGEVLSCEFLVFATGTSSPRPSKVASADKHGACEELRATQHSVLEAQSIAVVGGGAVGVELATDIASFYPDKRVTLFHSRDRLMVGYGERLHERTMEGMRDLKIETRLGVRPKFMAVDVDGAGKEMQALQLPNGSVENFDLVIPCTGQKPNSGLLRDVLPDAVDSASGRIRVHPTLQIDSSTGGIDHWFALGDVADTKGPKMGRAAMMQAQVVAGNIMTMIKGSRPRQVYKPWPTVEGAIHLTLGMTAAALYSTDGKGKESLINANNGQEDGEAPKLWWLMGAKYNEDLAMKEV